MTAARDSQKSYEGIGAEYVTYVIDNSTLVYDATKAGGCQYVGRAVKLGASDDTVALVGDGEKVEGKLLLVEADGRCNVQTEGFTTLPGGNGATLTIGSSFVGALDAGSVGGCIKAGTTAGVAGGDIVNNDDTANVVVDLD